MLLIILRARKPTGDTKLLLVCSVVTLLMVGISNISCTDKMVDTGTSLTGHTIEAVIKEHTEELMSIPGVAGVGQGLCDNKPCIKVYIIESTPELNRKIPALLDGYRVSTEVTGRIRAHPSD
jgi:hypothetical protein